jgi:hypothetical protein
MVSQWPNKSLEDDGGSPVLFVSFLLLIVSPYRRRASALRSVAPVGCRAFYLSTL